MKTEYFLWPLLINSGDIFCLDQPAIPEMARYSSAEQTWTLTGVGGGGGEGRDYWTLCHSQTEGKIDKKKKKQQSEKEKVTYKDRERDKERGKEKARAPAARDKQTLTAGHEQGRHIHRRHKLE